MDIGETIIKAVSGLREVTKTGSRADGSSPSTNEGLVEWKTRGLNTVEKMRTHATRSILG
jgi:hypothetical protein